MNGVYRRREKGSKPGEVGEWHCEVGWGGTGRGGEGSTGCGRKVSKREGERNVITEQARKRNVQQRSLLSPSWVGEWLVGACDGDIVGDAVGSDVVGTSVG